MTWVKALLASGTALLAFSAAPALGQAADSGQAGDAIAVTGEHTLFYPSVGQMNDHMHERGELMVGLRLERSRFGGRPRSGSRTVGDEELDAAGYMMRGKSMTMDMAMLDLMYAPSDNVTLTLSPQYMWNRMTMVGLDVPMAPMDPMDPMDDMDGPMAMAEMVDETGGFGDTFVAASLRLARGAPVDANATMGVWIPTGAVDRTNDMGTLLDYSMQLGSGTWDLEPSVTVSGNEGRFGWGAQAGYRWRAEKRNEAGFAFGDRARASGWLSYLAGPGVSLTARAEFSHQGRIEGEFAGPHYEMMSPADRPFNYGGDVVTGSVGVNWQPWAQGRGPQLGLEASVPLHQKLNGVQMPQSWRVGTAIRHTF